MTEYEPATDKDNLRLNKDGKVMLSPINSGIKISPAEVDALGRLLMATVARIDRQFGPYDMQGLLEGVWEEFGFSIDVPTTVPRFGKSTILPVGPEGLYLKFKYFDSRFTGTRLTGWQLVRYDDTGACKGLGIAFDGGKVSHLNNPAKDFSWSTMREITQYTSRRAALLRLFGNCLRRWTNYPRVEWPIWRTSWLCWK